MIIKIIDLTIIFRKYIEKKVFSLSEKYFVFWHKSTVSMREK